MVDSHGLFVWYELTTTNVEAAKAFYAEVVGWGSQDASMPGVPYTVFTAGAASVGGLLNLSKVAREMGEKPSWIGYVAVNDVDATANRITQIGGAVYVQPRNLLNVSRFSIVADPQMATLALFESPKPGQEQQPMSLRTMGHIGWHELLAADWEQAWAFYSELFGWQKAETDIGLTGTYQLFSAAGQTIGGMYTKPPIMPVPFWLYYFNVGAIDAAVKRVKAGGGQVLTDPIEVPGGSWMVHCTDPQGAIFALIGHNGVGYFERVGSRQEAQRAR